MLLDQLPLELLMLIIDHTQEFTPSALRPSKQLCICSYISRVFKIPAQRQLYERIWLESEKEVLNYLNSNATKFYKTQGITLKGADIQVESAKRVLEVVEGKLLHVELDTAGEFDLSLLLDTKFANLDSVHLNMPVTAPTTDFPFQLTRLYLGPNFTNSASDSAIHLPTRLIQPTIQFLDILSMDDDFIDNVSGILPSLPIKSISIGHTFLQPEHMTTLPLERFHTSCDGKKKEFVGLTILLSALSRSLYHLSLELWGRFEVKKGKRLMKLLELPTLSKLKEITLYYEDEVDLNVVAELRGKWEKRDVKVSIEKMELVEEDDDFETEEEGGEESSSSEDESN